MYNFIFHCKTAKNLGKSSNVLIPSLDLACSERITLKVLISIHGLIVKQMAQTIFSTKTNKIWTRSHRLNILLYEFGQRRREFDGKSLFAISNRSLIDDQGELSSMFRLIVYDFCDFPDLFLQLWPNNCRLKIMIMKVFSQNMTFLAKI